jgi:3-hydroxyisobutyrate dehydrogenase-like beta-hydroxyacid dehydrogenase
MGLAMATNAQKHLTERSLPPLKYWNRTISRGEPLEKIGGVACQSPEELVEDCDVMFISVSHHQPPSKTEILKQRRSVTTKPSKP